MRCALVGALTGSTFRDHLILEHQVPKHGGDIGQPNVFVPFQAEVCEKKVQHSMGTFQSQHSEQRLLPDTFISRPRLAGDGMQFAQRFGQGALLPQADAGARTSRECRRMTPTTIVRLG